VRYSHLYLVTYCIVVDILFVIPGYKFVKAIPVKGGGKP
jgi:hypothetical protein